MVMESGRLNFALTKVKGNTIKKETKRVPGTDTKKTEVEHVSLGSKAKWI